MKLFVKTLNKIMTKEQIQNRIEELNVIHTDILNIINEKKEELLQIVEEKDAMKLKMLPNIDEYKHLIGKTYKDSNDCYLKIYNVYITQYGILNVAGFVAYECLEIDVFDTSYLNFHKSSVEISSEKFDEVFREYIDKYSQYLNISLK